MAEEQRGERRGGITTDGKVQLCHYLANDDQVRQLLAVIGSYVSDSGLASTRHEVDDITSAIVSATIVRAFDIVETKYQGQGVHPWLLRIAGNLIKEKRRERALQNKYEPLMTSLVGTQRQRMSDSDFFALVHASLIESPEQVIGERLQLQQALAALSPEDRMILNLHIVQEYTHAEMMQAFGQINPSTQRMRCKRAIDRLRAAWDAQEEQKRGGEYA